MLDTRKEEKKVRRERENAQTQGQLATYGSKTPKNEQKVLTEQAQNEQLPEKKRNSSLETIKRRSSGAIESAYSTAKKTTRVSKETLYFIVPRKKNQTKPVKGFDFPGLNSDEKKLITEAIWRTENNNLEQAAQSIRKTACISKEFYKSVNDEGNFPAHMLFLEKHGASKENTCKALRTPPAIKKLSLQTGFLDFLRDTTTTEDETTTTSSKNEKRKLDILTQFEKNGADFNFTYGLKKITPLIEVVCMNDHELANGLITSKGKADPTMADANGKTPLEYAKEFADPAMCKIIQTAIDERQTS